MPRKNVFRGPEATTYQLLHRSLRDPEINNPEASDRVLSQVVKGKGKARATQFDPSDFANLDLRDNEGEAANYGIHFDDSDYDYMQHLRSTGTSREAVFVPAPPRRPEQKKRPVILPDEALPAHPDDERDYSELVEIPSRAHGLQPDLDPSLRETLEALDDEAFVDEEWVDGGEQGDDFFDELVRYGEKEAGDHGRMGEEPPDLVHLDRLRAVSPGSTMSPGSDEFGSDEEAGDTVADLRPSLAVGTRLPKAPASQASGFSMSSSSMFRSNGLQNLDDQFDEIEKEYADSETDDDDNASSIDGADALDVHDFTIFDPTEKRGDLDAMMDEFLSRYEVLGGKLKPAFEGATPSAKLDTLRRELRDGTISDGLDQDEKAKITAMADAMARRAAKTAERTELVPVERYEDKYERWDCETILSTYSNLENHPRLLSAKGFLEKREPRIRLDPRTGVPSFVTEAARPAGALSKDLSVGPPRETVTRPRNETPAERRVRKQQVKADRQERRTEKKATKATFENERRRQQSRMATQLTKAADVSAHEGGPTIIKLS